MPNTRTKPGEVYLRVVRGASPHARIEALEVYDAAGCHVGNLPFTGYKWREQVGQIDGPGIFEFSVHSGRVEVADGF